MDSDVVRYSRQSDGLGVVLGSLWWPRPYYPTRLERAALVAHALPGWAVASGSTAAWVWSGFGYAEPWCVLRHQTPAISPLERTQWAALTLNPTHHAVEKLAGLALLGVRDTVREVLLGAGDIDVAAAQVWALTSDDHQSLWNLCRHKRANSIQRHRAEKVLCRVDQLRSIYPDITL